MHTTVCFFFHLCSFDFCPLGFVFTGKSLTPTFHACKCNRGKAVSGLFASRPCQKCVGTHGCSAEEGSWSRNYFLPPPTEEMELERYTRSLIITAILQPKMQHHNMKACLFHSLLHFYCLWVKEQTYDWAGLRDKTIINVSSGLLMIFQ